MKLILVRHGETFEKSLTIKGVKQSIEVGKKLKDRKVDAIYCSIADRCGQTMEEIIRQNPEGNFKIFMTSLLAPKLKKESLTELKSRVNLFVDDLKYDHEDSETIMVVSHQKVIQMLAYLINKTERKAIEHAEMVELDWQTHHSASLHEQEKSR